MADEGSEGLMAEKNGVLCVDDEPALPEPGKMYLERSSDFTVIISPSVAEAIRVLKEERSAAIVSDYQVSGWTIKQPHTHMHHMEYTLWESLMDERRSQDRNKSCDDQRRGARTGCLGVER